jgi:hypothetical protein
MKRTVLAALAVAAAAVSGAASAQGAAHAIGEAYRDAARYQEYSYPYNGNYAYASPEDHRYWRHEHERCEAPRWDPNARYMPGQTVRRNGQVYVATEVSRRVYNVNSPPEWTPNYWQPARC